MIESGLQFRLDYVTRRLEINEISDWSSLLSGCRNINLLLNFIAFEDEDTKKKDEKRAIKNEAEE